MAELKRVSPDDLATGESLLDSVLATSSERLRVAVERPDDFRGALDAILEIGKLSVKQQRVIKSRHERMAKRASRTRRRSHTWVVGEVKKQTGGTICFCMVEGCNIGPFVERRGA